MYKLNNGSKLLNDFRNSDRSSGSMTSFRASKETLDDIDEILEDSDLLDSRSELIRLLISVGLKEVEGKICATGSSQEPEVRHHA